MRHLGSRASALVDGRLRGRELDRALAHLGRCPQCAALVAQEAELAARLRALSCRVPPAPALPAPGAAGRWEPLAWSAQRHRRAATRSAVAAGTLALALGVVALLGANPRTLEAEELVTAGQLDREPVAFSSAVVEPDLWALPTELGEGVSVSRVLVHELGGQEVLEVEIAGMGGTVHLYEVRGAVTAAAASAGLDAVQCGGIGVALHGDEPLRSHVREALPARPLDESLRDRLERGVAAVRGMLGGR